jgi:hypothetical protein
LDEIREYFHVSWIIKALQPGKFPSSRRAQHSPQHRDAERRRRFQFCLARFQSIGRLFLQLSQITNRRPRAAAKNPERGRRAHVPDVVGSRLPSPYHFPARIQSFQAVAAPFPGGDSLPSVVSVFQTVVLHTGSRKAAPARPGLGKPEEPKNHHNTDHVFQKETLQKN